MNKKNPRGSRGEPKSEPRGSGRGLPKFELPESARPGKKSSGRASQVASSVRQEIGTMLTDGSIKDPRVAGAMVTITDVEMTPDLKLARVYFSVFPSEPDVIKAVLTGLRSASKEMKREVSARLKMRFTPDLEFRLDESLAEGYKIEKILSEIRESSDDSDEET